MIKNFANKVRRTLHSLRSAPRTGAAVLMYHGIVERDDQVLDAWTLQVDEFRRQLEFLQEHFQIISADALVSAIQSGNHSPHHIVLTFDDAFQNLVEVAAPLMEARGIPYSVGVPIGLTLSGRTIWSLEVRLLMNAVPDEALGLLADMLPKVELTAETAVAELKKLPESKRMQCCDELHRQLVDDYSRALADSPHRLASIDDLRGLNQDLVTFMGHGFLHSWMGGTSCVGTVNREACESRAAIREHLEVEAASYIYPNGRHTDELQRALSSAGYQAAFVAGNQSVSGDDLFRIQRINAAIPCDELLQTLQTAS